MASVHKHSSQSSKSSSFDSKSGNGGRSWGRRLADEIWDDFDLPISRKGRFFQDSSFEHARDDFDAAVQDVLKKWGGEKDSFFDDKWDDSRDRNLRHSDSFSRYRNLRSRNLKDDNQAVTVTSDNTTHKIVLDVHGLQEGDVKVKLMGERELLVEGRLNAGDSQPFKRRFSLPQDVKIDAITSVLSSDGILTITAPKTGRQSTDRGSNIPINVTETAKTTTTTSESSNLNSTSKTANSASSASGNKESVEQEEEDECDCDVCVAKYGKKSTQQKAAKTDSQNGSQTKETQSTFTSESRTESKQGGNNLNSGTNNGYMNTSGSKEKINRESEQKESVSSASSSKNASSETQQSESKQGSTESKTQQSQKSSSSSASVKSEFRDSPFSFRESLPIKRRGHFFDDSFFEDTHKDFYTSVNDILRKWGETDLLDDAWDNNLRRSESFSRYRKLREHNLKDDNQAITVTSDNNTHKIVLDVQEFMEGDVRVKLVGERELVVEGHNPGTSRNFKRSFPLPENVKIKEITSVMSSDGILTITAPKTVSQTKESNTTMPIKVCQTESHTSTSSTTSKTADTHVDDHKQTTDQSSHEQKEKTAENRENISQESFKHSVHSQESSKISGSSSAQKAEEGKLSESEKGRKSEEESRYVSSKMSESNRSASASIPIKKREGLFFKDSFFETAWKDYQDAMRDVLTQWGDDTASYRKDKAGSFSEDLSSSYRKLRSSDMREENQAISSTEDEHSYKFIVDVHDFMDGGDINVRAVEDRELVVQGRMDVTDETGFKSTKRFLRLFDLPDDVRCEDVYSVMSSDGILTIIAPKKSSKLQLKEEERREAMTQQDSASVNQSASSCTHEETISSARQSGQETQIEDHVIPVKVIVTEDGQIVNVNAGEMDSQSRKEEQRQKSASREREININVETVDKDAAMQKDVHFADDEEEVDAVHRRLDEDHKKTKDAEDSDLETANENTESTKLKYMIKDFDDVYKNKLIPIKTRGPFFEDFFFEDSRQSFNTAVREVLEKSAEKVPSSGDIYAAYRNLRQRNLQLYNQAGRMDEDSRFQWIVLDVYDFLDGEVTAEVVDGKEIVVKGGAKRHEGNSVVTISFLRPFQLSEHVNLEAITATMSSDGVLIIIAPKLPLSSEVGGAHEEDTADRERLSRIDAGEVAGRLLKDRNFRESSTESEGRSYRLASPQRGRKEISIERQSADRCERQTRSSSRDSPAKFRHSPDLASSRTLSQREGGGRSWEEVEEKHGKKSAWEDSSTGNSSSSYSFSSSSSSNYHAERKHSSN